MNLDEFFESVEADQEDGGVRIRTAHVARDIAHDQDGGEEQGIEDDPRADPRRAIATEAPGGVPALDHGEQYQQTGRQVV